MEAKLVVIGGKANMGEVKLRLPMTIGRGKTADLLISHPTVSREHCHLLEVNGALFVRDNNSSNGVYVDGKKVTESVVRPGQTLAIGPLTFRAEYIPETDLSPYESEAKERSLADTTATDVDEFDFLMDEPKPAPGKPSKQSAKAPTTAKAGPTEAKGKPAVKPGADPKKPVAPAAKGPGEKTPAKAPAAKSPAPPADVHETAEVDLDEFWKDDVVEAPAAKSPAKAAPGAGEGKKPSEAKKPSEPAKPAKVEPPQPAEAKGPKIGPPAAPPAAEPDFDFLSELDTPKAEPKFDGLPRVDEVPDTAHWSVEPAAGGSEPTATFNFDDLLSDEPVQAKGKSTEAPVIQPSASPAAEPTAAPAAKRTEVEPDFDLEPSAETVAAPIDAGPAPAAPLPVENREPVESREVDPFDFLKKETDADREAPPAESVAAPQDLSPSRDSEPDFGFLTEDSERPGIVTEEGSASSSPTIEMPSHDVDEPVEMIPPVNLVAPSTPIPAVESSPDVVPSAEMEATSPSIDEPATVADPWSFLETQSEAPAAKADEEFDLSFVDEPAPSPDATEPAAESAGGTAEAGIAADAAKDEFDLSPLEPVAAEEAPAIEAKQEVPAAFEPAFEPEPEVLPEATSQGAPPEVEVSAAEPWMPEAVEQTPASSATSDDEFDLSLLDEPSPTTAASQAGPTPHEGPAAQDTFEVQEAPSAVSLPEMTPPAVPHQELPQDAVSQEASDATIAWKPQPTEAPASESLAADAPTPEVAAWDDVPVAPSASETPQETAAAWPAAAEKEPDFTAFSFDDEPAAKPTEEIPAAAAPETDWLEPTPLAPPVPEAASPADPATPERAIESAPIAPASPAAEEKPSEAFPDFAEEAREKERAMFSFLDAPAAPSTPSLSAPSPSTPHEIAANTSTGAGDDLDVTAFLDEGSAPTPGAPAASDEVAPVSMPAAESTDPPEAGIPAFRPSPSPATAPAAKAGGKKATAKPSIFEQLKTLFTGKKGAAKKPAAKPAQGKASAAPSAAPVFAPPPSQDAPIPLSDAPIPLADDTIPISDAPAASEPDVATSSGPVDFGAGTVAPSFDTVAQAGDSKPAAPADDFTIDFGDEPAAGIAPPVAPPAEAKFEKTADNWGDPIPLDDAPASPAFAVEEPVSETPAAPAAPEAVAETAPAAAAEAVDDWFARETTAPATPETTPVAEPGVDSWTSLSQAPPAADSSVPAALDDELAALLSDTPSTPTAPAEGRVEPVVEPWAESAATVPASEAPARAEDDVFSFADGPMAVAGNTLADADPAAAGEFAVPSEPVADAADEIPLSMETAWSETPDTTSPAAASESAWPTEEALPVGAGIGSTESESAPVAPIADFAPASSPAAPERPRRPQVVDIDVRHSPSTRLLTPVALRRPHVDVPVMVPDVPAGRSFEAKSRPPAAPSEASAPVETSPSSDWPSEGSPSNGSPTEGGLFDTSSTPAGFATGDAESRDLDVTAAWSPATSGGRAADAPSTQAAAADDWTFDAGEPPADEQAQATEPQWDTFASTPADAAATSKPAVPAAPAEPDLGFFLDDVDDQSDERSSAPTAAQAAESVPVAADPWANIPAPATTDDDALSFLQLDSGAGQPPAQALGEETASSAVPPAPPAAESKPAWGVPEAETPATAGGSAGSSTSDGDLDFGFLDLEVSDAKTVEPAAQDEVIDLQLDTGDAPAAPSPPAAAAPAEEDDPFFFLRKPGEKGAEGSSGPSKPSGASPKQQEKDKDLDDFLSDLGM